MSIQISVERQLDLYSSMLKIRRLEEELYLLFSTRNMPGTMHQYIGEEAVAAGVCACLTRQDYVTSTHRGHGHCVAKGVSINALMAEMFARSAGCNRGMGGSMHIADFSVGMLGANGIVGGGIPIATGAGITCKLEGKRRIAVAFFGDGAANEGAFHESLNIASALKLPVLYVCENNLYGFSTQYRRVTNVEDIAVRSAGYGIQGVVADGMDVLDVYRKAAKAIEEIRNTNMPVLLECKTYRYMGHARFEKPCYREKQEVDQWKKRDAIAALRSRLIEQGGFEMESRLQQIEENTDREIHDAVKFAEASPFPDAQDFKKYIFASPENTAGR